MKMEKSYILVYIFIFIASINVHAKEIYVNFENIKLKHLPPQWKARETNPKKQQSYWEVTSDKTAPTPTHVLTPQHVENNSGNTFNICWSKKISFKNGTLSVYFKALDGYEDQGGGLIWRVQNKNRYYIARFNPLEDNFRLYYVNNGRRTTLASANVSLSNDMWHKMTITQNGDHFEAYLDNTKYLEGTDNHLNKSGGVGLWSKADAQTSFDNLTVKQRNAP